MSGQATTRKVFLSHTSEMAEYPEGRSFVQAAKDAVNETDFLLDDMQFFPATDKSPQQLDTERLTDCDIYVGILGFKYGSTVRDQTDVSYTQDEFRKAHELGKTLLVFMLDEQTKGLPAAAILDAEHGAKQIAFRKEVQDLDGKGLVCAYFNSADGLQHLVVRALDYLKRGGQADATSAPSTVDLFDSILSAYSSGQLDHWQACLRGEFDRHDRLDHYVEPHYALLKSEAQFVQASDRLGQRKPDADEMGRDQGYEPVAAEGDNAEEELAKLLSASTRLCLAEDAGAGKSVFTRRTLAFACSQYGRDALFDGKSCLAVRWEQWENDWPTDFERALADAIADDCNVLDTQLSPNDLVAWALRKGRVLLILDGLDQVASDNVIHGVANFLNGAGRNCRVVVTGRSYKVQRSRRTLFRASDWRFARIEGFDDDQIAEYLKEYEVDKLFPQRAVVADLLRIPSVLRIVRELLEQGDLESFKTRGELYLQASYHLILHGQLIDANFDERQTRRIEQILAAVAFEMMRRELYGYAARGVDTVDQVERGASRRCENGVSDREWSLVRDVSNLTNHCILEGNSQAMLSWQHRGMMEFYCGLHLARHATDQCVEEAKPFAGAGDWHWAWRFAIELPDHVADPEIRTRALTNLYRRPTEGRRPNELIYRAWNSMGCTPAGREVLAEFQNEYRALLDQGNPSAAQIEESFRPCPPDSASDRLNFAMGSPDSDGDAYHNEKPQAEMTVEPFEMSNASATKQQYWLYDPSHRNDPEFADQLQTYSPEDNCPVIFVSWYDAWCFARWCGSCLPTEVQWEYACRAGTTTGYWWDDEMDKSKCTFETKHTTPASESHANPWGLMEMSGNVREWCETWYDAQIETANRADFVGESRVVRGGSFGSNLPQDLRSADRGRLTPDYRDLNYGFRLSRTT